MLKNSLSIILLFISTAIFSQNELDDILNQQLETAKPEKQFVYATFKGTKLINGHSIESPGPGVLQFIIYHRFGEMKDMVYNFFGLDEATTRIGLDYGLSRRLSFGIGRTKVLKAVDGYVKYKPLIQTTDNSVPLTIGLVSGVSYNTIRSDFYEDDPSLRFNYLNQVLLARKFSPSFSLQLMPTMVYNNLAETAQDKNMVFAGGYGARVKISKRTSVNWEHYVLMPNQLNANARNTVALGFDIDTGGHIFQFHLTNAASMIEQQFIPNTSGDIFDQQFRLGFNISRVFTVNKKAAK